LNFWIWIFKFLV